MCFSAAINAFAWCCNYRVCLPYPLPNPPARSQELEGRGSFIATFKSTSQSLDSLLALSEILDDFEVLKLFERDFDEPPTVAVCKLESYPQFKIDLDWFSASRV